MARRWLRALAWPWVALRWAWNYLGGGSLARVAIRAMIVLAALGVGALLFVAAGLVPVAASAGHWPITRVLLHFAMRRSVATHSLGIEAPPLDDPDLVLKGAGHYASGCMPCHGAPGQPRPLVARQIVPEPPYLPPIARDFAPAERFWVVKHGIKYTAMPAWPSQRRDDEVWAMVAFLQRLPDMSPERFRQLAYGDGATGDDPADVTSAPGATLSTLNMPTPSTLANCARCHGSDGEGRGGAVPRLAGQREAYLLGSLRAYARGDRDSGIMQPVAAALDAAEITALARHYASLDSRQASPSAEPDTDAVQRGATLATDGDAARRIPACVACHGPGAEVRNPHYPRLAGQHADYLQLQLTLFNNGMRGGSAYAPIMHTVAGSLEPRDIRDLAAFFSSLPATPQGPAD